MGRIELDGEGDIVIVLSGRNVDDDKFLQYMQQAATSHNGVGYQSHDLVPFSSRRSDRAHKQIGELYFSFGS